MKDIIGEIGGFRESGRAAGPATRRRRVFTVILWLLVVLSGSAGAVLGREYLVYVGTYTGQGSEGIYTFRFDPAAEGPTAIGLAAKTDNPSFLVADPEGRFLYAANEILTFQGRPTGAISVFAIGRESGRLRLLQQAPSLGIEPAYLSLDGTARYLLVANYDAKSDAGGNSAVFPVGPDGRLGPRSAFARDAGSGPDPERQARPHPHSIQVTPDNRFVLVADLGLDKLLLHRFDGTKGSLKRADPGSVELDPGAGPRHVDFAPSGRVLYVVNELSSTVAVYAYEPGPGRLAWKQEVSTLPKDFAGKSLAAEIAVDAKGRFLYVTNRGHDSIAVFAIDPGSGKLAPIEHVPSGGRAPRHFAIDPTGAWIFVANQGSDEIRLFRIDPASGRLAATSRAWKIGSPVCVLIVPVGSADHDL